MVVWWVVVIIAAGSVILSGLLQKIPKAPASSLGEMQMPTAEEGRNLPVIFGTCCLRAPNVVWYGDYKVKEIKKSKGMFGLFGSYTAGYKYYLGMDLALCHGPVDAMVEMRAGVGEDLKPINAWLSATPNPDNSRSIYVRDKKCFGGDDREGGLEGNGTFYFGQTNFGYQAQQGSLYMSQKLGIPYPAYAGVCHVVCEQWYLGTSRYIKNIAFVLRRCPSNLGLSTGQTNINGDANPAEIIYECLQNKTWGLGFPSQRFDLDSFRSAGQTLASEGFGMSLVIDSPQQADKLIETVLQHIDGVVYTDPATGLWTLKLIRPDYNPQNIPEFTEEDIAECEFSRGSWEDTVNEVKVTFTDRTKWKQGMVQAQEPSNFTIRRGEIASVTIDFPGFTSAAVAQKACNRELRTASYPIARGRLKLNRKAWALRMGSPFRLTWSPLGIAGMCCRVTSIDYGSLTDGTIEVEFCEDVFAANYTAYAAPAESGWTDPIGYPVAPAAQLAMEAPYQMLDGLSQPRVLVGAVRADGSSMGYEIWTDEGSGYIQTNTAGFCPSGLLTAAYPRSTPAVDTAGFTLTDSRDLEDLVSMDAAGRDRGDNLLYFADTGEICAWQTITDNGDGTYTLAGIVRGVYDTLPADHAQGTRVYVIRNAGTDFLADCRP